MKTQIVKFPHSVLTEPGIPIDFEKFDLKTLRDIIKLMFDTMREHGGCGIAAQQIGLPFNIIIANGVVYINPQYTFTGGSKTFKIEEGCLSLPAKYEVKRLDKILVTYYDIFGRFHSHTLNGKDAIIFQHETDHTAGILISDHTKHPGCVWSKPNEGSIE